MTKERNTLTARNRGGHLCEGHRATEEQSAQERGKQDTPPTVALVA